jgi:hypothetical protein
MARPLKPRFAGVKGKTQNIVLYREKRRYKTQCIVQVIPKSLVHGWDRLSASDPGGTEARARRSVAKGRVPAHRVKRDLLVTRREVVRRSVGVEQHIFRLDP